MVQVLDEPYSASAQFGAGLGKSIPNMTQQFLDVFARKKENEALSKRGIDLTGISDPTTRAAIIQESLKRGTAINQGIGTVPKQFRSNGAQSTAQGLLGNAPQGSPQSQSMQDTGQSQGQSTPYIEPDQIGQVAAQRVQEKAQMGVPTTYEDELSNIDAQNQRVLNNESQRQQSGSIAEAALANVYPKASDEMKGILKGKAQDYASKGILGAALEKKLALDAKRFANQLNSVKRSLPPKRLFTRVKNAALGTGRAQQKTNQSIQNKLKPILDLGLYEDARNILSEVGYAPEERETILSNLGEIAKKNVAQLTKPKHFFHTFSGFDDHELPRDSVEYDNFKNNIKNVLKQDPATNLILLRKAYEDKGVDWRAFKDELDNLTTSEEFIADDEQSKAMDILDEPPLNKLDRALHGIKLVGR